MLLKVCCSIKYYYIVNCTLLHFNILFSNVVTGCPTNIVPPGIRISNIKGSSCTKALVFSWSESKNFAKKIMHCAIFSHRCKNGKGLDKLCKHFSNVRKTFPNLSRSRQKSEKIDNHSSGIDPVSAKNGQFFTKLNKKNASFDAM